MMVGSVPFTLSVGSVRPARIINTIVQGKQCMQAVCTSFIGSSLLGPRCRLAARQGKIIFSHYRQLAQTRKYLAVSSREIRTNHKYVSPADACRGVGSSQRRFAGAGPALAWCSALTMVGVDAKISTLRCASVVPARLPALSPRIKKPPPLPPTHSHTPAQKIKTGEDPALLGHSSPQMRPQEFPRITKCADAPG